MEPPEEKLLFVFAREALRKKDEDRINTAKRNPTRVQSLRSLGLVHPKEDRLTAKAFCVYFSTFDEIECPQQVQCWVSRLGISDIRWRRPSGFILSLMPQERGLAYPLLSTVFIGKGADLSTWFHELGHIVFARINGDDIATLAQSARNAFPVVPSKNVTDAIDPKTQEAIALPPGLYLNLNGQYLGLDHSGEGEEIVTDEIWASLFAERCNGLSLPAEIQSIIDKIVDSLQVRQDG